MSLRWRAAAALHHWDYAWLLPWMARLPLPLGYALSALRGALNAAAARDWRSMALRTRHILRMSRAGARALVEQGLLTTGREAACVKQRFAVEARDEFEARLMHAGRLSELQCRFEPPDAPRRLQAALRTRGVVLLTPHFDSFYLGIAFLAQACGVRMHAMASAVPADPRVDEAVTRHFFDKYRGLEKALNGGQVVDMEDGVRPFYRMLQSREALVVLADAPVLPGGAHMQVPFLGRRRELAGGAMRLAQRTDAAVGAFVCRHEGGSRYVLRWCDTGPADEAGLARLYGFLGEAIVAEPGRWWAMDMLPNLPAVESTEPRLPVQGLADVPPQVDVVLVNYRSADLIAQAIARLQPEGRAWPHGWIHVVDNSEDAQEEAALRRALDRSAHHAGTPERLPVRLTVMPRNVGFAAACNAAWRASQAPLVLLLNPDAHLSPDAVMAMARTMQADATLAALSPRTWWDRIGGWVLPCPTPQHRRARMKRAKGSRREPHAWACTQALATLEQMGRDRPFEVEMLAGAVVMLRREAVRSIGEAPFDESFFMYFEDADLSDRLRAAGWRLAIDPRIDAVHTWRAQPHKAPLMAAAESLYRRKMPRPYRALQALWPAVETMGTLGPAAHRLRDAGQAARVLGAVKALSPVASGDPAWVRPHAAPLREDEWSLLEPGAYWAWTDAGWQGFVKEAP